MYNFKGSGSGDEQFMGEVRNMQARKVGGTLGMERHLVIILKLGKKIYWRKR